MAKSGTLNFRVEGGRKLSGSVTVNSSKNGAVALLAASLLNHSETILRHVPKIEEVGRLIEVLLSIGVSVKWEKDSLRIRRPEKFSLSKIDRVAATRTRSILMFVGALVHELKEFRIPQAGGCKLGSRTVRPHLYALKAFGISIEAESKTYVVKRRRLKGAEIVMLEASDTATVNALLAAAGIPEKSVIKYASANYQVQEVCHFLTRLGVSIEGIGTTTMTVVGRRAINTEIEYALSEDPTDAMFFIAAAATTHSSIIIRRAPIDFLELELLVLSTMHFRFRLGIPYLSKNGVTRLVDIQTLPSRLIAAPEKIHARPYPGLNMDNLPFFAVIATQARGATLIHDWVYEKRAIYYTELDKLGAETLLADPHRISITGPTPLRAAELVCPPALRPATIILIGMLAAKGTSVLRNVYSINRGYADLVQRVNALGGRIESFGDPT